MAAGTRQAALLFMLGAVLTAAAFWAALKATPLASPREMVRMQFEHSGPGPTPPATASEPRLPDGLRVGSGGRKANGANSAYLRVGFRTLASFPFTLTAPMLHAPPRRGKDQTPALDQIPKEIQALNNKAVALTGFMLPVNLQGGLTTDFLIMRNRSMCCYGIPPRITEWVNVHLARKEGVKPLMDQPITVCGTFHVGELRQNGDLVGVYQMDASEVLEQ